MIEQFIMPFAAIGLAELGDKTQLAIFCLASKTKRHFELLLGAVAAFFIAQLIAVLLGGFITKIIPVSYIKLIAGIIFILFGIVSLLQKTEEGASCSVKNPFLSSFGLILISEMGDKTQLASGLFAAQGSPLLVLGGAMLALTLLSVMGIYLGKLALKRIPMKLCNKAAGTLFILIGVIQMLQVLF